MQRHACLFEAKSIQDYILRSGRLRHIVGASELIDALTRRLLDDVLFALGLDEGQIVFSRRAGGAVYAFSADKDALDAFRDLWTLVVSQYAPGLEFLIAQGEGDTDYHAYRAALQQLQVGRNRQPAALPAGTPVTRYAPRTGRPAIASGKGGLLDAATACFEREAQRDRPQGLAWRFDPNSRNDDWPRNLEFSPEPQGSAFPFTGDNRYLGLIHADGNGLGQLLMKLGDHVQSDPASFTTLFARFSAAIEQATQAAAREATRQILEPQRRAQPAPAGQPQTRVYPARPIVLGGDDLTILVRADLALPFTEAFLLAFERFSGEELTRMRQEFPGLKGLPQTLTAGAGIAFVKSNHPFYLAHELAESIARYAKDQAKQHRSETGRIPPSLCFHRVTTASHGDYSDVRERELTFSAGPEAYITSLGAYSLDPPWSGSPPGGLPALADLSALAGLLGQDRMARGPARQLLTLIGQDLADARRRYARWREVMRTRDAGGLEAMLSQLETLCGGLEEHLPVVRLRPATTSERPLFATPLGDVATWLAITNRVEAAGMNQPDDRSEDRP